MATVINPTLPYSATVDNVLAVGSILQVKGTINDDRGFAINFKTEESDYALHFNPRFSDDVVVMNTKKEGKWDEEERVPCSGLGLQRGEPIDLTILVESDKYMINLNGKHFGHFAHRLKAKKVKQIDVKGDADVSLIRLGTAFSSAPITNPAVPFLASIPGGFQTERMLLVYGVATGDQFSINLQCGHELFHNVALHVNPRVSAGTIVLNSTINGNWEAEQVNEVSLPVGHAFVFEIVNHADVFEVRVNGTELGQFAHRHPDDHPDHRLDMLHITGDLQLHLVHF